MTRGFSGISNYSSLVFDCDGVILNSNRIKTNAFYETTKQFGNKYASALVDYHVLNGGVSRYVKFNYFITKILNRKLDPILYEELLYRFANEVKKGLNDCEVAIGLKELSLLTSKANWLIVSGGEQSELRETFAAKNLEQYFLGGIFGSPSTKDIIIKREKERKNINKPAIFIGDSKYDYQVAKKNDLDFLFLSDWSELPDWRQWIKEKNICEVPSIKDIL